MEKRLFLHWVALRASGVAPGNVESPATVVADFADSRLAFGDRTAVSAGEAADPLVAEMFVESGVGLNDLLVEDSAEG
jgi:hypothetical protein